MDNDIYVVAIGSGGKGKIEAVSIVDSDLAQSTARQLRYGGRSVRCLDREKYLELLDRDYQEYWKNRRFEDCTNYSFTR